MKLKEASLRCLVRGPSGFGLERLHCYVTEKIAEKLSKHTEKVIINGIFNTITIDKVEHKILSDVISYINEVKEMVNTITGLVSTARFDMMGRTLLGVYAEFEKEVFRVTSLFESDFAFANIRDRHKLLFDESFRAFFPILIQDDENKEIYFLHPIFLSFLSYIERFDLLFGSGKELLDLIKISEYTDRYKARLSEHAENLQKAGIRKRDLLSSLPLIKNGINYSHILRT
ncbi:MAG: hypothetical protein WA421_04865 [Nitrososphaeraceae archaeon]